MLRFFCLPQRGGSVMRPRVLCQAMEAERFYALALEAACNNKIRVTNVVRLGLALNTALFCDEILHQPEKALKIAQEAFSLAMAEVTTLQVGTAQRLSCPSYTGDYLTCRGTLLEPRVQRRDAFDGVVGR